MTRHFLSKEFLVRFPGYTARRLRPLVFGLGAMCAWVSLALATPPDIKWNQIETEHFVLIYDSKHKELAAIYAQFAEQAWVSVAPVFGLWPRKTVMLIDDSTDIANGSATGLPYPTINAYPVLPTSLDSVSDYGNWGLELLTHEYTHILNFEPATGIMRPLRWVFGSIVRPNILLPRWYSEGLAVEMETRLSSFGRLRSANYLSIIRAMTEDGTLRKEDISRINEVSIPGWPGGVRPYLMGALVWDQLVREKGDGIIGELNLAYSRRLPFFLNGPLEDRLGIGYQALLNRVYARTDALVKRQLELIQNAGLLEETELEQSGYFSHSPTISPDGKLLAWIGKEHNVDSQIFIAERDSEGKFAPAAPVAAVTDGTVINRVSWFPDSRSFVHDGIETFDRYYGFSDLFRYDLNDRKGKQLTRGLRAREPVISPDGKSIVFIQVTPGSTRLAAVRADGSLLSVLYEPPLQTRLSRVDFLSASEVVFSEKRDDGSETLKALRLKDSDGRLVQDGSDMPRTILPEFRPVHFPRMTKAGLVFVSDRSGVANVYLASRDLKTARAITNSTTRTMTPEIDASNGDLFYGKLTSYGPQIYRSPRSSWANWATNPAAKARAGSPPMVGPLLDSQWPQYAKPQVNVKVEHEEYSPWWYLLPRYWLPYVYVAPGISYFSASTSANDPTGRHAYALSAAYDTQTSASSVYGSYTNATTRVPITLLGLNSTEYVYSGGFKRQTTTVSGSGSFFLPGLSSNWQGGLGWDYTNTIVDPISLRRNGATAAVSYRNLKQRGYEISPEKGGAFSVNYTRYFPGISDIEYDVTAVSASKFFAKGILPERHVFALFLNSSIAPRLNSSVFGTSTTGGNYQTLPGLRGFVMRGYNNGVFLGRNVISATAEYRFPLMYSYRGYRTAPFFLQRWHGDIFADAITLDGLVYDYSAKRYSAEKLGRPFYGTGVEAKLDATVFYHLPVQFIFGLYFGADSRANPAGVFPFIGLGM